MTAEDRGSDSALTAGGGGVEPEAQQEDAKSASAGETAPEPEAVATAAAETAAASASSVAANRPLDGVLVVDLTRYLPGPLVTRLLADLGARVLKIEEPKLGDPSRQAPPLIDGRSSLASILLAGHESLALDLKKEAARDLVEDLLMSADVLVESMRPGALERMGLAPAELRRLFPGLVICSVTGWGQDGEHAHRAGHDLGYQAIAGSLAAGGGMPAVQVADIVGGWSAALAVSSALVRRQQTGDGCWIDQSLLDAAGHASLTAWAEEAGGAKEVAEPLMLTGAYPCYDLYRTADDGTLALAALEPKFWQRWCSAVERRDLIPRQLSREPKIRQQVAQIVRGRSREEWAAILAEHDIPGEPVLSPAEALNHPQVAHRGMIQPVEDGSLRLGYPAKFDGERPRSGDRVPELGEDTQDLMREFGVGTELSALGRRRAGIGRRFSIKKWAIRAATAVATRRKP